MSIESNLICRLTAFIAWDESEKVAVATHELVQPSMELAKSCHFVGGGAHAGKARAAKRMVAPSPAAAAPPLDGMLCELEQAPGSVSETRPGLFRKLAKRLAPDRLKEAAALDEVGLKRELSDICHRIGVADWQPLVKAILDWIAAANSVEKIQRITDANRLLSEIQHNCGRVAILAGREKPAGLEQLRKDIQQQLKSFVDKLPAAK